MSTSVVSSSAILGPETRLGEFCVIGDNVKIGSGSVIGHYVSIQEGTVIGDNVRIDDGATIGKLPMKAANSAVTKDTELPHCTISSGCIIGTGVVIYRGTEIGEKVLVADLATVRENVKIGKGTIVGRGVAIENYCTIGRFVKLETNCYITAYSEIEDRAFVAPCVATSNDNFLGRTEERFKHFKGVIIRKGARIGVHATILPGKEIEEDALVAASALVNHNVPARKVVAGIPARTAKDVPEEQLLKNQGWKDD
ncbi:MAG: DapH/DapD/GlmU-related protein [candidate division Zixibacteria bacterium]|nr:DapH/DapD/GlmU-related protein [candidate division Zixibacteria bacterium]